MINGWKTFKYFFLNLFNHFNHNRNHYQALISVIYMTISLFFSLWKYIIFTKIKKRKTNISSSTALANSSKLYVISRLEREKLNLFQKKFFLIVIVILLWLILLLLLLIFILVLQKFSQLFIV